MQRKATLLGVLLPLVSLGVIAQDKIDEIGVREHSEEDFQLSIGALIGTDKSIYVGGRNQTQLFPFIQLQWKNFFFQGPELGFILYEDENWRISSATEFDGIGNTNRDDSVVLADMTDFDTIFLGKFGISYQDEWGEVGFSVAADISNTHDGYTTQASYSYPFYAGGFIFNPEISVEWVSKDINRYYYGVNKTHVKEDRPYYMPNSGVNYELGFSVLYPFMEHHAILLLIGYTKYSAEVSDSPVVDTDNDTNFAIGYSYRF